MIKILGVKFKDACKVYDFDPADFNIRRGEKVVVDTEMGMGLATAATEIREMAEEAVTKQLKRIVRIATSEDIERERKNREKEGQALSVCLQKVKERGLPMKLVSVEYAFNENKAIFFFTADGRIDFRELVRDLAHEFHVRIEMKQIGVRDAAKKMGGVGPCGKELCCSSYLTEFGPVSVKMAKEQGLSLNPTKISGVCGRLMCCLAYEHVPKGAKPQGSHSGGCGGGCHSHEDDKKAPANGEIPEQETEVQS